MMNNLILCHGEDYNHDKKLRYDIVIATTTIDTIMDAIDGVVIKLVLGFDYN